MPRFRHSLLDLRGASSGELSFVSLMFIALFNLRCYAACLSVADVVTLRQEESYPYRTPIYSSPTLIFCASPNSPSSAEVASLHSGTLGNGVQFFRSRFFDVC